ncbi:hypothetical protein B0H14DRAFT_3483556 [Mycena olivaceomarginata]|nr:hypothetical protein B0H14DRAFT_3483556 [Mycena olivaceomarginata]
MNDPRAIIAKDWANPSTHKFIHVYPEIPEDGVIREVWHAQKWRKDMDLDILSPMYASGTSHYYVNEVSRLHNGKFVDYFDDLQRLITPSGRMTELQGGVPALLNEHAERQRS